MRIGDREFSTEEVAALCGVTRVTVVDWISRGLLEARLTPGGRRRVPRASLAVLMERQGYELPRVVAAERPLVFVVDDEAMWRNSLRTMLERDGDLQVETFGHGADVLIAIGARRPDVLILDMVMPGFDGRQIIQAIRADEALNSIAIIALTSYIEELASARRYGANLAIQKDEAREVRRHVAQVLHETQRRVAP